MKLKKNDLVVVTTGKDKGKQARIERIYKDKGQVLLPNINQYKKHRKPQGEGRPGEILSLSRPLDAAKVAIICPKCKMQTRVGYRFQDGKRIRVCRKCEADI